jgi:Ser/Thr protein kinase RdoA (MazF antagonist)
MTFNIAAREWLARSTGATAQTLRLERMKGSTSSSIFLVERTDASQPQRFVLRVLDNSQWLAEEPDLAVHEAAALQEAEAAGLQAPRLVAYSPDDAGFGAPVVLMSFLNGSIELRPADFAAWLHGLAVELAAIHRHTAPAFAWRFRSWVNRPALQTPPWTTRPRVWERAIALVLGGEPAFDPVFIHRDYHPTNVLWREGLASRVTGVVDWINACRGPAGADVAHCRTNLAQMFGPQVAEQFLQSYCAVAGGFTYDPYWDVDSVLDCCFPQPTFYPPWRDFGLDYITPQVLCQRVDAYLEQLISN